MTNLQDFNSTVVWLLKLPVFIFITCLLWAGIEYILQLIDQDKDKRSPKTSSSND